MNLTPVDNIRISNSLTTTKNQYPTLVAEVTDVIYFLPINEMAGLTMQA